MFLDKPSAPQNLNPAAVFKDAVELNWELPESDGGSPITGYVIERRDANRNTWVNAGTARPEQRSFKVTKLYEGNEYCFRVAAENAVGIGEFAELPTPIKPQPPFGNFLKQQF